MFETPALGSMINDHLYRLESTDAPTKFSSWAASISIAAAYAGANSSTGKPHLAVVDTNLLPPYALVYHTPALAHARISRIDNFTHEYLIYGPVCGPAFSCVPFSELQAMGWFCRTQGRLVRAAERVEIAKRIAQMFGRRYNERPDVVVALTAIVLASLGGSHRDVTRSSLRREILKQLKQEIGTIRLPAPPAVGLVNPRTYYTGYPEIKLMVSLLMDVEGEIRERLLKAKKATTNWSFFVL
ncbi:hypothetical protein F4775DRAFT_607077 [Biscogniauxia sp. FL1348]|nr:hypothetical protein F4775DRAFT_607077 [Biscogniauxia sp. FL1348]